MSSALFGIHATVEHTRAIVAAKGGSISLASRVAADASRLGDAARAGAIMRADVEFLQRIVRAAGGAIERIVRRKAELLHPPANAPDVVERAAQRRAQSRGLSGFQV